CKARVVTTWGLRVARVRCGAALGERETFVNPRIAPRTVDDRRGNFPDATACREACRFACRYATCTGHLGQALTWDRWNRICVRRPPFRRNGRPHFERCAREGDR